MRLKAHRVTGDNIQLETLRLIRNECRTFMTRNTSVITPEEQARWWRDEVPKLDLRVYLFELLPLCSIGYGIVNVMAPIEEGIDHMPEAWLAGGVSEALRGYGLGTELFAFLRDKGFKRASSCWLEVLVSNERAQKVYKKLGFQEESRTERLITMFCERGRA